MMFNMEFDDDTLAHEFQAANCLFSELVDIGGDGAADQLFDVDILTAGNVEFSEDNNNSGIILSVSNASCPTPQRSTPVITESETSVKQNKIHKQSRAGQKVSRTSWPTSRNAARERSRVKSLRSAFLRLQNSLPSVPPNTKLSKLDVLVLATTYIAHLMKTLDDSANVQRDNEDVTTISAGNVLATGDNTSITPSSYLTASNASAQTDRLQTLSAGGMAAVEVRHHRLHEKGYLHPVRKWPMRSRLYAGAFDADKRQPTIGSTCVTSTTVPAKNFLVTTRTLPELPNATKNDDKADCGDGCSPIVMPSMAMEPSCSFDELFGFPT